MLKWQKHCWQQISTVGTVYTEYKKLKLSAVILGIILLL